MSGAVVSELNIAGARARDREQILRAVALVNRGEREVVWITEDGKRIAAIVSLARVREAAQ